MNDAPERIWNRLLPGIGIVLVVCALVYLPMLGRGGLAMSEGHRVIPAWEMLDSGEWLVPHLFGQPYLRKPPGMPWGIALSSELFGRTEFAARFVSAASATLMAVIALLWSRRWFGPRGALGAGLAQALMPQMWMWGRTAEIEALNALGAQILLFGALETLRTRRGHWALVLLLGLLLSALAKGPAAAPCLAGALGAGMIVLGPGKTLKNPWVWTGLVIGAALIAVGVALINHRVESLGQPVVTQPVSSFMWEPDRLLGVLAFPAAAWVSALPASLALLFPWGPGARTELEQGSPLSTARLASWAWVLSIVVYTLAGVSNPRYALPAACLFAPLVGYVLSGRHDRLNTIRARIARALLLGAAPVWVAVLVVAAGGYIATVEHRSRSSSGQAAGEQLAAQIVELVEQGRLTSLSGRIVIAADHLIEARPEVLAYAASAARAHGVSLAARWMPGALAPPAEEVALIALRADDASPESSLVLPGWVEVGTWTVHEYRFRCLVRGTENVP